MRVRETSEIADTAENPRQPEVHDRRYQASPMPMPAPSARLGLLRTYLRTRKVKDRGIGFLRTLPGMPVRRVRSALAAGRSEARGALRDWGLQNPPAMLALARRLRRVAPRSHLRWAAETVATARTAGWEAVAPLLPAPGPAGDARSFASAETLLAPPRDCAADIALPRPDRPLHLDRRMAERLVVYTCWFRSAPRLAPVHGGPEGLRMICFSDHRAAIPGWEILPADPAEGSEHYRMRPHRVLAKVAPKAEWSLYLAPDRLLMGNLHTLFARWLLPNPFALWRQPGGGDWHDLAERHLVSASRLAEAVLAQADACAREGLPRERAAWDIRFLWRRHAAPEVAAAMDVWWMLEQEAPGSPELSLCRALARTPLRPVALPATLGQAESNIFSGQYLRPATRLAAPPRRRARVPITFLYSGRWADAGCTIMRGKQLSRMIADRHADRYDVTYTADVNAVRDQIVIVNRMAIEEMPAEALDSLRARGNLLVSDWQDLPIVPDKNAVFDAHLALSPPQQAEMSRLFPETPVFHVTHHVNPDVPHVVPPADRLRTVFFGFFRNTVVPASLRDRVDFAHAVNADFTAEHWRAIAPRYNCHWIVRQISRGEWRKPFLKGFVAARCGAPVIVTRDDQNAAYYLGDDYPFFAQSVAPAELERVWVRAASAFGTAEWALALEIMRQVEARSTDAIVCADFAHMVTELVG